MSAGEPLRREDDGPRCFAHVLRPGKTYCLKINSIASYQAANRDVSATQHQKSFIRHGGPLPHAWLVVCVNDLSRARCSVSTKINPSLLDLLCIYLLPPLLP